MAAATPIKLGYWDIRGLAEPIRHMLAYAGADFEDVRYKVTGDATSGWDRSAWLDIKSTLGLTYPNLPYIIDGDVKLTQSNAIVRYVANKYGLAGANDAEKAYVDMHMEQLMDLRNAIVRCAYNVADHEALAKQLSEETAPHQLGLLEAAIAGDFLCASGVTGADFVLVELTDQLDLQFPGILAPFPKVQALRAKFLELPAIKEYRASDRFHARPINNPMASFK